jgi:hypothetical protein
MNGCNKLPATWRGQLFEKAETVFSINLLGGLYEVITKGEMAVRYRIRPIVLFFSLREKMTILAYLALILYTEFSTMKSANCSFSSSGYERTNILRHLHLRWYI